VPHPYCPTASSTTVGGTAHTSSMGRTCGSPTAAGRGWQSGTGRMTARRGRRDGLRLRPQPLRHRWQPRGPRQDRLPSLRRRHEARGGQGCTQTCAGAGAAQQIPDMADIKGGLIAHAGCDDRTLRAALRASDSFLVHGLDADPAGSGKGPTSTTAPRGSPARNAFASSMVTAPCRFLSSIWKSRGAGTPSAVSVPSPFLSHCLNCWVTASGWRAPCPRAQETPHATITTTRKIAVHTRSRVPKVPTSFLSLAGPVMLRRQAYAGPCLPAPR